MTYSMYAYVEAFINEKQKAWITAHVHMYEYFGGVAKILVPDNCLTAVYHTGDWYTPSLNTTYHELAEHYGTAITYQIIQITFHVGIIDISISAVRQLADLPFLFVNA